MSTTTLPPVPPPGPPSVDEREALIKEAQRRARRRRSPYAIAAVLAAGSAAAGFSGFHGGGSLPRVAPAESAAGGPQQNRPAPAPRAIRNGPLALVDDVGTRVVLIGAGGRFFRSLPICRPPRCGGLQSIAWSPDGTTLAYGTWTGPGGQFHPRDGLHLFDVARNKDRRLIPGQPWAEWQDLAWSPNGKRLAYVVRFAIYIINLERQEITTLRAHSASPSWSPNGKLIAYDRFYGKGGIFVSRPDGSHSRRLSKFGAAPAWSPSGNLIAYEVRCGIRLMTQTGKDVTANAVWRCAHIGVPGAPVWSPDGRRIAIGGAKGVFVMNANGSGLTRIWARPALRPSWRPLLG